MRQFGKNGSSMMGNIINVITALIFFAVFLTPSPVTGQIEFREVTDEAGISYMGMSFGASWGDFNSDGWPDLWVGNHSSSPNLYLNQCDGTFEDIALEVVDKLSGDIHGAAWADFDNDGDQDLIELVGAQCGTGTGPNHLFLNTGTILQDRAAIFALEYPLGRGRTPLWFDVNGDGLLDILLANFARQEAPSALFQQGVAGFQDVSNSVGLELSQTTKFAQLSDLNDDGLLDLICHGWPYPQRVYDMHTLPLQDLTDTIGLPPTQNVQDAAVADLNGDLLSDLYLCRVQNVSDAIQVDDHRIEAHLVVNKDTGLDCESGFSFMTNGNVNFSLFPNWGVDPCEIFIGFDGHHPEELSFTLVPEDTTAWGIQAHDPVRDGGIYVGYEPATKVWKLLLSNPHYDAINAVAEMNMPASNVRCIGFVPFIPTIYPTLQDRLLIRGHDGFEDKTVAANLGIATACEAVVTGDFDNDMDLDLYLVCTGPVANLPNILYENQGNGTYVAVPDAGGAVGSTLGRGENVGTADYDGDGFLDLFVTNGKGAPPFSDDGPSQLFRNLGHDNNWIEIDLEGVVSNRDGIGARVLATAGGCTQLREQGGGMHCFGQNHQRIHFGLGSNTKIDRLVIQWPSGIEQEIDNVPTNQILHVIEPSIQCEADFDEDGDVDGLDLAVFAADFGETDCNGDCESDLDKDGDVDGGDLAVFAADFGRTDCLPVGSKNWLPQPYGAPAYDLDKEAGIFLWKHIGGPWHLRATAGSDHMRYVGSVVSDLPAITVMAKHLEANDVLEIRDLTHINFDLKICHGRVDGFDFQYPQEANVYLDLEPPEGAADSIYIGRERWSVSRLPLDLSGW